MSKKYNWHKIAEHINELTFAENNIAVVDMTEKKICVGKHNDSLFAFAYRCPHAGAPLSDGFIDAVGNIVCSFHHYRFDLKNGRNTTGEGFYLKTWPVENREDGIYVGMDENKGLFGWLK
jgi:nitrite reductase/ring-hydroxylating ferredoxin subunit